MKLFNLIGISIVALILLFAVRRIIVALYMIPWILKGWKAGNDKELIKHVGRFIAETSFAALIIFAVKYIVKAVDSQITWFSNIDFFTVLIFIISILCLGIIFIVIYYLFGKRNPLKRQQIALRNAIESSDIEKVKELIKNGVDVNYHGFDGITPLMLASGIENFLISEELIKAGAIISDEDDFGFTPLLCAAQEGNIDLIQLLLEKGANVNEKSKYNYPLH